MWLESFFVLERIGHCFAQSENIRRQSIHVSVCCIWSLKCVIRTAFNMSFCQKRIRCSIGMSIEFDSI